MDNPLFTALPAVTFLTAIFAIIHDTREPRQIRIPLRSEPIRGPHWFSIFLSICIPVLIFYGVWFAFKENLPFQDDIDGILEPATAFSKAPVSFSHSFGLLWEQDDERRIIMVRLVSFLVYLFEGQVDFRLVGLAGMLTYPIFLALLFSWFKRQTKVSLLFFLPLPFLLFNNFNYAALYWSLLPLQQIGVYVWGFTALWFLSVKKRTGFVAGVFFAFLSIASDVNGNFILPAGAIVFLLQKRKAALLLWTAVMAPVCGLYFYNLAVPDFRPTFRENLGHWQDMLVMIVAMPGMMADVLCSLLPKYRIIIAMMAGLVSICIVAGFFRSVIRVYLKGRNQPTSGQVWIVACLSFLIITFLAFALGRAAYGAENILLDRYKHMYVFWGIFNYLIIIQFSNFPTEQRVAYLVVQSLAVIYFASSYFQTWGDMDFLRKTIQADAYGWEHNREIPSSPIYVTIKKRVDAAFEDALNAGIYDLPGSQFDKVAHAPVRGHARLTMIENEFLIANMEGCHRAPGRDDGFYLILKAPGELHVLPMKTNRNSLCRFLKTGVYYRGHTESIPLLRQYLDKNVTYKMFVGVIRGDAFYQLATGSKLTLKP